MQRLDSSSLDSSQGIGVGCNRLQKTKEEHSNQPDLSRRLEELWEEQMESYSETKPTCPSLNLSAAQPEINMNSFSKRVVQEWKDEYVGPKYYSISPVSSHENSVISEDSIDQTELKSLDSCAVGSQASLELCQEALKNDEFFRLMAPSERMFRRAVLNYRTQRRHSLEDAIKSNGFIPLLPKQEKQWMQSEDNFQVSYSRPLLEIPFWSNRCRRAVSLTLSHNDLLEDLECICSTSQGGGSFVDLEASSECVSMDKCNIRRHPRHLDGSSGGFYSREDNRVNKEDCTSHVGNSRYHEDRLSFKKRFREMFRASKHRGFICCVYCGAECWAPNGRYHFNSCKVYNGRIRDETVGRDMTNTLSHVNSTTHHSDTSRCDSQQASLKKSRFRHWSEAARVEGFKKTLDRPGYVVCLKCGEHVWAPNSRRHASMCFLTNETQPVLKRSRRRCSDKQDCVTNTETCSVLCDSQGLTYSHLSLSNVEKNEECCHHGDSESSLSKNQETDDFCTEHVSEKCSGENSQISNEAEWNGYLGGFDESKERMSQIPFDSNHHKNESIASNFRRSTTRKGWLECRHCEGLVWPPNAFRHIRNCEK
ncbi:hypothetical protein Gasu2_48720 [Galdieria sulphuraria]|uniref:Uncharacterized protein n=1 Tax=Galdieria sulphuraria TaxID=130081 RepID=M2XF95_GALSU|nr:uncharacterized protein Gasu_38800 [Galdieria sulphuraria]EME28672.1 hypothetical protein Gasu_38800 [Galdieria sulphuraria]GJD10695.1 hypothetical protein Gasu2_48720 [Galdieria sulphuraria]|eukprot:XP_005705192.1 hypothetical protein Gasu_38800 [Galdieria sulphuraria]